MPSFKTLWDNFPDHDQVKARCFNKRNCSPLLRVWLTGEQVAGTLTVI